MPLTVQVVTPEREVEVADDATFVLAHGVEGDVGILPGHAPLLIALGAGPLAIEREGDRRGVIAVDGGFLQVSRDQVIVLAEYAVLPHEVDQAAISSEIEELRRALDAAAEPDARDLRARIRRREMVLQVARA